MNRLPWFKFYPADWRKDPELGAVSIGARGLWIELMAIMHECVPPGVALLGSTPATNRQIAQLARVSEADVDRLLGELIGAHVAERRPDGAIFCRRMYREELTKEKMSAAATKRVTGALRLDNGKFSAEEQPNARSQNNSQEEKRSMSVASPTDDGSSLRSAACAAPLGASPTTAAQAPATGTAAAVVPAAAIAPAPDPEPIARRAWWAEWWAATDGRTALGCYDPAAGQMVKARPGPMEQPIAAAYRRAAARVGHDAILAATRRAVEASAASRKPMPQVVAYLDGL